MKLHHFFLSSASFRVRIALHLKGLPFEHASVHLRRGEHRLPGYAARLGDALVPALETDDGALLGQSIAIIEYLEETHPEPALLPSEPLARHHVRALAQLIACEVHPLANLRVLQYLVREVGTTEAVKNAWYHHWVREGLCAFERQLVLLDAERARAGEVPSRYCWGATPTLADCVLVPQIFNAQRFGVPLDGLPRIDTAFAACMQLPAFQRAQPSACPDHEA